DVSPFLSSVAGIHGDDSGWTPVARFLSDFGRRHATVRTARQLPACPARRPTPHRDRANRAQCGDRPLWPHDQAHRHVSPARPNRDGLRLPRAVSGAESAGSAVALTECNRLRISQARTLPPFGTVFAGHSLHSVTTHNSMFCSRWVALR